MEVKPYEITENITTFCMQVENFPAGIDGTFKTLGELIGGFHSREVYGISEMANGKMAYRACVKEQYPGEAAKYNLPCYVIPQGKYVATALKNWRQHTAEINGIFGQLMQHPDAKMHSIVLEYYKNEDEALLMLEHR